MLGLLNKEIWEIVILSAHLEHYHKILIFLNKEYQII
jgi:hypothetical protein